MEESGGIAGCICFTCGTKLRLPDGSAAAALALDDAVHAATGGIRKKKRKRKDDDVGAATG